MSETYVQEAQSWADFLIKREYRGPGDTLDAAMGRCERRHKISRASLWALRYRPPKDLMVSVYMTLRDAYHAELEKADARLRHEISLAEALGTDETYPQAYRMACAALGQPGVQS